MELEDILAKEAKEILKWVKKEVNFGNMAGRNYVNMEEIKWNLGKVEGLKSAIQKILKSKGISLKDFEKKYS
tara:strand:- start:423 stop:638 length:216 start_codon:yes stop_codon:yes gene_type:complete